MPAAMNSDADGPMGVVHQLRTLVVDLHLLGTEFARANGLHPTDVRALICLLDAMRAEQPATPTWLREQLHLNSASVTALVDRLERAGHVVRRRDDSDRRKVLLEVTPAAMELGSSFFGPIIGSATSSLNTYSDDELAVVERFLADMQRAVSAGDQPEVH